MSSDRLSHRSKRQNLLDLVEKMADLSEFKLLQSQNAHPGFCEVFDRFHCEGAEYGRCLHLLLCSHDLSTVTLLLYFWMAYYNMSCSLVILLMICNNSLGPINARFFLLLLLPRHQIHV